MSNTTSILLVGDSIQDVYHKGNVLGLSNENHSLKWRALETTQTPGGVLFCKDLLEDRFENENLSIDLVKSSSSYIQRFITELGTTVFTIDDKPTINDDMWLQIKHLTMTKSYTHIYVWDDDRNKNLFGELTGLKYNLSLLPNMPLIYTDTSIGRTLEGWTTDYIKATKQNDYNLHPNTTHYDYSLITSAEQVHYRNWDCSVAIDIDVPVVPHVVDTCGAGDTFFTTFLKAKANNLPDNEALKWSIASSYIQVQHEGCYRLSNQEIKEAYSYIYKADPCSTL